MKLKKTSGMGTGGGLSAALVGGMTHGGEFFTVGDNSKDAKTAGLGNYLF